MRVWNFSLSESVTCPASSRASTMAGMSRQATISQRATSASAHELRQQRHAVAGRQLAVEVVGDAEERVVDEDLDVLGELLPETPGPADDLDRRRGHRSVRRGRSDSLRNSPRVRRRFTRSSYEDVRMMRSNWDR